ncbi:MAG: cysteine desulfurase [Candidatus Moranbacteria bacterium]|jgi:cysteine desulfurase|nr:cysteine desulfurase [Candidatus Moranbacteria bacterium]
MNNNKRIYLDYAATTPVDENVLKEMMPYFSEKFGNAMSVHGFGQEAQQAIDTARERVAKFFACSPSEIIFTSGATESNNLTVKGVVKSFFSVSRKKGEIPHIITTVFEHHCVLDACHAMEKEGLAEVTFLPVGKDGIVKIADVKKAIKPNTILISIMYVNNEIGTVQPIAEIGKLIQKLRSNNQGIHYPLLHTDATQGVNYFDCNVKKIEVDLLSFSGHKIYGPKGVGVLFVKRGTPIRRIQDGGDQEYKLRAGTHNVTGIVGLGKAVDMLTDSGKQQAIIKKIISLRDYLIKRVLTEIPASYLNGSKEKRSPNNANFRFDNVEGEGLILSLDLEEIATSTGSACSSGALEPSHVLLALGLRHEQAHGSLRVTIGKYTTKAELDRTVKVLKETVARLRKISGNVLSEFK